MIENSNNKNRIIEILKDTSILYHLVSVFTDHLDRVFFVLTCKQLYNSFKQLSTIPDYKLDDDQIGLQIQNFISYQTPLQFLAFKSTKSYINNSRNNNTHNNTRIYTSPAHPFTIDFLEFKEEGSISIDIETVIGSVPGDTKYLAISYDEVSFHLVSRVLKEIPQSVVYLKLISRCTHPIRIPTSLIPSTIIQLDLEGYSIQLQYDSIPRNVQKLSLGDHNLNYQELMGIIPDSVTHLKLGRSENVVNVLPVGVIPSSVRYLEMDSKFDGVLIEGAIPFGVTHLHMGVSWNQPIVSGQIPASVTHLYMGSSWNQELLPGSLPNSITHLNFGWEFNRELVVGSIPSSVQYLNLGENYELAPLEEGVIPRSTTHLYIGRFNYNQLNNKRGIILPVKHRNLSFQGSLGYSYSDFLADSVIPETIVNWETSFEVLPSHVLLDTLHMEPPIDINIELELLNRKPSSISMSDTYKSYQESDLCYICGQVDISPGSIKSNVTHLVIEDPFVLDAIILPDSIPSSVIYIGIQSWSFKQSISGLIPPTVLELSILQFDEDPYQVPYTHIFLKDIPPTVKHLIFKENTTRIHSSRE
eukprot:gene5646-7029_t